MYKNTNTGRKSKKLKCNKKTKKTLSTTQFLKTRGISLKSCRSLQLLRNYKLISFFGKNQTIQTVK